MYDFLINFKLAYLKSSEHLTCHVVRTIHAYNIAPKSGEHLHLMRSCPGQGEFVGLQGRQMLSFLLFEQDLGLGRITRY